MSKRDYELSLNDLCGGRTVADVYGYVSIEFGEPCFKITRLALTDGITLDVEGEHDIPYICAGGDVVSLPEAER